MKYLMLHLILLTFFFQFKIETRITVWDKYRHDQTNLMDWLKKMEKERNQLKLRYIHSETIVKTIAKIEVILQ